jgi:tetratricopeptide (TPR) repeat protein
MCRPPILLLFAARLLAQTSASDWRQQGLAAFSKGDMKRATTSMEKACAMEKPPGDSCYYLARFQHADGDFEMAGKTFRRALAAAPPALVGRLHRAAALNDLALGRTQEAEHGLRQSIRAGHEETQADLGAFLFREGRTAEAEAILGAAVGKLPEFARGHLELGRVLLQTGKLEAAVVHLEKATRLAPQDGSAHLLLGRAYQRQGRDAEAQRELEVGAMAWRRKQQQPEPPLP